MQMQELEFTAVN